MSIPNVLHTSHIAQWHFLCRIQQDRNLYIQCHRKNYKQCTLSIYSALNKLILHLNRRVLPSRRLQSYVCTWVVCVRMYVHKPINPLPFGQSVRSTHRGMSRTRTRPGSNHSFWCVTQAVECGQQRVSIWNAETRNETQTLPLPYPIKYR